jgi:predicted acyl esterase
MRQSTDRQAARPVRPAAAALSKMLSRADPLAGTVQISLIGAAHRFNRGHRVRLQVAGGAHPRFARNPGNGQVDAPAKDFVATRYEIDLSTSNLVLGQIAGKETAHA